MEAATLVHMYDNLNDACKSGGRQLVGYITLLQVIVNDCYLIVVFNNFLICSCVIEGLYVGVCMEI